MTPLLLVLATLSTAEAADQSLHYDLLLDGKSVGKRELTIRYVPDAMGNEARIYEMWTELDARPLGLPLNLEVRSSARMAHGRTSWVATVSRNGKTFEVQGRQQPDGSWKVLKQEGKELSTWTYRRTEVDLSSLDIYDAEHHERMLGKTTVRMLTAETGQISTGPLEERGAGRLKVGGTEVEVNRVRWTAEEGALDLAWSESGLLLDQDLRIMGRTVDSVLKTLPAERSWGSVEIEPFGGTGTKGSTVVEEEL